ncbi:RING/U-box superfamily protein [Striga hermonthica]|uniref:RING/U-box superfamily protein n=1 Tax=Striga hermonthica TaxID=68872 RepID=A0A9N7RT57_STRHE|nr:RING/U-box superfamily protein [Striga hermonthica]
MTRPTNFCASYARTRSQIVISSAFWGCPVSGCRGFLKPQHCPSILPDRVFVRWGEALCEAVILASEKLYWPFKDCSALLVDDSCGGMGRLKADERGSEDIMLVNLAKNMRWIRWPKCRFYVEKSGVFLFMICRILLHLELPNSSMASFDEAPPGYFKSSEKIYWNKCEHYHIVDKGADHKQGLVVFNNICLNANLAFWFQFSYFSNLAEMKDYLLVVV